MMLMMMHTKTVLAVREHERSTPSSSQSSSRRGSNEVEESGQCTSRQEIKTKHVWLPWLEPPPASGAPAFLSNTFTADLLNSAKASSVDGWARLQDELRHSRPSVDTEKHSKRCSVLTSVRIELGTRWTCMPRSMRCLPWSTRSARNG